MILRPLAALVAKDLRVFLVDRQAVVLTILAPIALASFMAAIFGGAGPSDPAPVPIRLVDEDRSPLSSAVVAAARADRAVAAERSSAARAAADVRNGRAVAAVILPPGFGAGASDALLGDGSPPELTILSDPTRQADLALARGVLTRLIFQAVAADALRSDGDEAAPAPADDPEKSDFLALFGGIDRAGEPDDPSLKSDRDEFRAAFPGLGDWTEPTAAGPPKPAPVGASAPFRTRDVSITSGKGGDRAALAGHAFAGMAVQFVLFSATEWGVGLLRERRRGLWKRLRSAPVSRYTLMASKGVGCGIVSLSTTLVVLGFGSLIYGYGIRGSAVGFALVVAANSAMTAAFGLMVAALGRSPEGARAVSILAVLTMTMLGGGWIPSFLFPAWLRSITPAIPTRWAIDGLDGVISRALTFSEVAPCIAALLGFALAFGVVAIVAYRWDET